MRGKSEKGSITIFVLVALLFYVSVLLLLYASNAAKMQSITKKAESVKAIYEKNINKEDELYNKRLAKGGETSSGGTAWVDNGDGTFSKGEMTVAIGDYVGYDHAKDASGNQLTTRYISYATANASPEKNNGRSSGYTEDQGFAVGSYNAGWQVLGVKNEKLLLISAGAINPDMGGEDGEYTLRGQEGYQYGPDELNAISAIYGQGKGASSARSINVNDINSITGYDPNKTGDGNPYGNGTIYQYGNDVTYYWDGTNYPYYSGANRKYGNLSGSHETNGFNWWSDNDWHSEAKSMTATVSKTEQITTLKSTNYYYYPYSLTTDSSTSGEKKGIDTDSKEYKVLFDQTYWLASRSIICNTISPYFNVYCVSSYVYDGDYRYVYSYNLYTTRNSASAYRQGVRPVVTLSSGTKIKSDDNHDGSTQARAYIIE